MTELATAEAPISAAPVAHGDLAAGNAARAESIPSQLISFAIGDDQYGVDIMSVREIKEWEDVRHLPRQPE